MKRLCCIVLIVFVNALYGQVQLENLYPLRHLDVTDRKIMAIVVSMYAQLIKREKAAWIVVNAHGEFEPVYWLNIPQDGKQFWNQILPPNIIALVHTHPDYVDPRPSKQDEAEARKLNVAIFTLARKGIWSVTPDSIIKQHADSGWFKSVKQKCGD